MDLSLSLSMFSTLITKLQYMGSVLSTLLLLIFITDLNIANFNNFDSADYISLLGIKDSNKQVNKTIKWNPKFPVQWLNTNEIVIFRGKKR